MRVIFAFTRTAFHNAAIYRLDFWARIISLFIMMYGSYSLWRILYSQSPDAFGMDLQSMTTYGVLGIILLPFMDSAMILQWYIVEQVRMGTLELDLLKPLGFISHMFARSQGEFWVYITTYGLTGFLFAFLFLNFQPPVNAKAGVIFVISLALGYLVYFNINMLMGILAIVVLDIRSYAWAFWSVVRFASGQVVPLWMFPPVIGAIVGFLPFKDVYYTPMAIYVGAYEGNYLRPILSQIAWGIVLLFLVRLAWSRVQRRIVIQGG